MEKLGGDFLSYRSFQRHAEQLLSLNGKLHRQLIEHLLCIAIDYQAHGLLGGDAALVAIEELVFAYLARRGLMFHYRRVVVNVHIRECMSTAITAEEQRIARTIVAGVVRVRCGTHQSAI